MTEITREIIEQQLAAIKEQQQQLVGQLNALEGQSRLCQHFLSQLENSNEIISETPLDAEPIKARSKNDAE